MPPRRRRSPWARPRKATTFPGAVSMAEAALQSKVGSYAVSRGALHYHTHNSERSEGGFPDSVIVGNYVLFRELKSDSNSATVSKKQRDWIERLRFAGADADVWWPCDWESGRIQNEINACTRQRSDTGRILLPDLGKILYLFSQAGVEGRAGLLWDAGHAGIDQITWQENGRQLMQMIANALPRGDVEVMGWIRRHRISPNADPTEIIEALRADLTAATTRGDVDA